MTSLATSIEHIATAARSSSIGADAAIEQLQQLAQARGGRAGRKDDGAFFTDADVASHLVRRAICARLLDAAGVPDAVIDDALASGADLHELLADRTRDDSTPRQAALRCLRTLVVLDPSCGAGSFLVSAWAELCEAAALLGAGEHGPSPSQLWGVDIDPEAVAACRAVLDIATGGRPDVAQVNIGDAQVAGTLPAGDIVVGNPPFVRAASTASVADLATAGVPNRSAWIVERALAAAAPGARTAFVLPISTACTDAFAPARDAWSAACDRVWSSHFDTIPSSLFRGVVQRLTILEGRVRLPRAEHEPVRWWTTKYHRWLRAERAAVLGAIRHVPLPVQSVGGSIAKVGTLLEADILDRVFEHPPAERLFVERVVAATPNQVLYKRRWSYFLLFTSFAPPMWDVDGQPRSPSELKALDIDPRVDAHALISVYSSSLFWWFFSVFTDNRNVNRRDLGAFPLPVLDAALAQALAGLGRELVDGLRACGEVRTCTYQSIGTIRNTYYRQGETRPVIDRIDAVLAQAYGFSPAQCRFVIDFERRFRSSTGPAASASEPRAEDVEGDRFDREQQSGGGRS